MKQRGDLIQLVTDLFRDNDEATRLEIAHRIADMARAAAATPLPAEEPYVLKPADAALLKDRAMPLADLDEAQLQALNSLLPWGAMSGDLSGRVLGSRWSAAKRARVSDLIDPRIAAFDAAWPLQGRHVMEVGCFEGIHAIGCLAHGARVTAVDVRMENILKTLARVWAYGFQAEVGVWDLEKGAPPASVPQTWDMLHHIGVLYHLANPAEHLALALDRTGDSLLLDTHVATDDADADQTYAALGRDFAYAHHPEKPISPFAGVKDHAKWLRIEDLEWICRDRGFTDVEVRDIRDERNGKRVLIWAFKPGRRR